MIWIAILFIGIILLSVIIYLCIEHEKIYDQHENILIDIEILNERINDYIDGKENTN